jgi:hypothetical protein
MRQPPGRSAAVIFQDAFCSFDGLAVPQLFASALWDSPFHGPGAQCVDGVLLRVRAGLAGGEVLDARDLGGLVGPDVQPHRVPEADRSRAGGLLLFSSFASRHVCVAGERVRRTNEGL